MASMDVKLYSAFAALGAMAVVPIYFGSKAAVKELIDKKQGKETNQELISDDDAKRFPIVGSLVLFSLYLLFRFVPREYFQMLLSGAIALSGAGALGELIHDGILLFFPFIIPFLGESFELLLLRGKTNRVFELKFDLLHFVLFAFTGAYAAYYEYSKDWIANNIFAVCLAFSAIKMMMLDRFRTGIILLSGLFLYDIFWVFGTEVMVTVAKSFDAPIKVLFPRDLFAEEFKFTMLGLGDIVIPGIFIALCLCFDEHRSGGKSSYPKPYFAACFIAYIIGLIVTVTSMQIFQAAQPALLYLSPACIFSVLFTAFRRGELHEFFAFSTHSHDHKKEASKSNVESKKSE